MSKQSDTQEIELTPKFILTRNNTVMQVFDLGTNERGSNEFVNVSDVFTLKNYEMFDSKKDAMYTKLIRELDSGKSLSNYKSSKYFKYYCERLKKEHPEFMI